LGDQITFKDLPEELQTESVAKALGFGAVASKGAGVVVCGSPGEVSNNLSLGGSAVHRGFDVANRYNRTTSSTDFQIQVSCYFSKMYWYFCPKLNLHISFLTAQDHMDNDCIEC